MAVFFSVFAIPTLSNCISIFFVFKYILQIKYSIRQFLLFSLSQSLLLLGITTAYISNTMFHQSPVGKFITFVFFQIESLFGTNFFSFALMFMFAFSPFIFLHSFFMLKKMKIKSALRTPLHTWIQSIFITIFSLVAFFGVGIAVLVGIFRIDDVCSRKRLDLFSEFHGHIKNVCIREDKGECPRDESQLRAFNPVRYDELKKCTTPKYEFNAQTGQYLWSIKHNGKPVIQKSEFWE